MKWTEPKYSKNKVKNAGKLLAFENVEGEEYQNARNVFTNWRSSHAYPMQIMLDLLRNHARKVNDNAVVVQRLKREKSILQKLRNEKNMSLSRIEDIAGCRAVMSNIDEVYKVIQSLAKSKTSSKRQRVRDYFITNSKPSGYRGFHIIYKYNGSKNQFKGLYVELQIRSQIQHSWATAVEVVGTFTGQALKASRGQKRWLEFFQYCSAEFAQLEGTDVSTNLKEINTHPNFCILLKELDVLKRLSAFSVATRFVNDRFNKEGAGYFIIQLNLQERLLSTTRFEPREFNKAEAFYNEQELKIKDRSVTDLVLVSAESIVELKKAYPNYFADTEAFAQNLHTVLNRPKT